MKEKLTRNIGLKILAIILAVILWLVITNVDDPVTTKYYSNIKVELLNVDEIKALNQVYNITEGATIDFTAAARRSVADKLSKEDFKVTADLSKLSDLNTVTINISYLGSERGVNITRGLNQVMKVDLEDLVDGHFKVNVRQTGELAEGCYIYEKTASTILNISGPRSKIDNIADVVVDVDVTDYTRSFNIVQEPKVLDAKGKEIDTTNLTFSKTKIPVFIGMYNTKTINLNIAPTGTPANGFIMTNIEYEPKTIEVAADDDVLKTINDLTIREKLDGVSENVEKEINLQEQLPEGVVLVGDNQTAVINITIGKPETKEITILPSDIDVRNIPDGMRINYLTTGPITVKLQGPAKEINEITKDKVKPYIDLTNYSAGTFSVLIDADISSYTTVANMPTVNIHLERQ